MKRLLLLLGVVWTLAAGVPFACAGDAAPPAATPTNETATEAVKPAGTMTEQEKTAAAVGAAAAVRAVQGPREPDFLEHLVDEVLGLFNMRSSGNTVTHYAVSAFLLIAALLLRRVITGFVFSQLRRLASKTRTTLDDKLFPALEPPVATIVLLIGIFAALKVLKLPEVSDNALRYGWRVAFLLSVFWGLWRALAALMEHGHEIATAKHMGIAAFMPWIKRTVLAVFVVIAALTTIESLGGDVKAILTGLGIGGLAFALAAQDTLANIFGAIVVAIDQPFRIGEAVRIGQNTGNVEDIGLRSTRIRLVDKSLMVIPNKTVAAETITNLSRFTRRRVEQVFGLTYDTKPEQMEEIVAEIRRIVTAQPEVDGAGAMVYFRDLNASSLDIWVVYETPDPDFQKSMAVRQRINLAIMRAVAARGLSFAFPTQTVHLAGDVAENLAAGHEPPTHDAPAPRS